jgi:hypothetical protein
MVERVNPALPISQQGRLLALPRSSVYRKPAEVSAEDLAIMVLIERDSRSPQRNSVARSRRDIKEPQGAPIPYVSLGSRAVKLPMGICFRMTSDSRHCCSGFPFSGATCIAEDAFCARAILCSAAAQQRYKIMHN